MQSRHLLKAYYMPDPLLYDGNMVTEDISLLPWTRQFIEDDKHVKK